MAILQRLRNIGPGAMVAAAFIGPGTVTTATISGASTGYTLLWAVAFSAIATYILQEMSARLGVGGKMGVGEAIREKLKPGPIKLLGFILVIGAVFLGNAAYEAGNLTGASLGFNGLFESDQFFRPFLFVIALLAILLLYSGRYRVIERSLILLVGVMGIVFIISMILLKPDMSLLLRGLFIPSVPNGSGLMILGIIGTTVVPYNLFLHASSAKRKWTNTSHVGDARFDTLISVIVGGFITLAILVCSAVAFQGDARSIETAADLGIQLEPILGSWSELFIAIGFFAAGLSSSITAPLAAAFATTEVLGWSVDMRGKGFRAVWLAVILCGLLFSLLGIRPTALILFAQVANGLLLPIVAGFLLWIMNDRNIMGSYANSTLNNAAAIFVILLTIALGFKGIYGAFV